MISSFAAKSAEVSPISLTHPHSIDFSIIDTVIGAVAAVAVMIVVGFLLIKYGVVKIGSDKQYVNYEEEIIRDREIRRVDRIEVREEIKDFFTTLRTDISEIRNDLKVYAREHQECQRQLPEKYVQWEIFNRMMDELKRDRKERWDKFDAHTHEVLGGPIVIKNK